MKLSSLFFLLALLLGSMAPSVLAQDAIEGNYDFMRRETAPGLSIVVLGQPKSVEAVVEQVFRAQADERARSRKGMMAFEKTRFSPISAERIDYYFTVESPSRRDDEHSRVNLIMRNSDTEDFITSVKYPRTIANAKIWLADLELETKVYEMGLVIEEQQEVLEDAMDEKEDLRENSTKLQEELLELKQEIADNRQALADQQAAVQAEQEKLKAFEAKLKGLREERDVLREARKRAGTILNTGNNNR